LREAAFIYILRFTFTLKKIILFIFQIAEKRRANKEAMEEEEEDDLPAVGSNPNDNKNTVRQRRQ
jgi:hypothetical protein